MNCYVRPSYISVTFFVVWIMTCCNNYKFYYKQYNKLSVQNNLQSQPNKSNLERNFFFSEITFILESNFVMDWATAQQDSLYWAKYKNDRKYLQISKNEISLYQ